MSAENFLVKKNRHLKATRQHRNKKPQPQRPHQWWGIDMTVMIENYSWVYVIIEWFTKKVVAHEAGVQFQSCCWLMELDKVAKLPMGKAQVSLSSDNSCQSCECRAILS